MNHSLQHPCERRLSEEGIKNFAAKVARTIILVAGLLLVAPCEEVLAATRVGTTLCASQRAHSHRFLRTRCEKCLRCRDRPKSFYGSRSAAMRKRCLWCRKNQASIKKPTPTPVATSTPTTTPTVTPTQSNTPTPSGTRTPAPSPPIPLLAEWESNMVRYGAIHCAELSPSSSLTEDERLTAVQYDSEWVFYQIAGYTHDTSWLKCAERAEVVYRDHYVIPNNGVVPAHMNFTSGLFLDYLSTGDLASKSAVALISTHAAYCPDYTPLEWTIDAKMSREVAYAIRSHLHAEALGVGHRARTDALVDQALGHIDQWFVAQSTEYVRPFMFALTAEALIAYHEVTNDPRILPAVEVGARWVWRECWLPERGAFKYTDRVVESGGTEPAPDLNLLIAPVYGWLWNRTGDPAYREMGDQIFSGGVRGAWLVGGKQFNQNYSSSFDYVRWRSAPPLSSRNQLSVRVSSHKQP